MDRKAASVTQFIEKVLNGGDMEVLGQYCSDGVIWRAGSLGEVRGLAAYRQVLLASASCITGMSLAVKELIPAGDKVVVSFINSGVNTGPFLGYPAAGKAAQWPGLGIFTLNDYKIDEINFVVDILGLLIQLGHVIPPALQNKT
jgi:predicted ester cyclase